MPSTPSPTVSLRSYAAHSDEHIHSFSQWVLQLAGKLHMRTGGREGCVQQGRAAFVARGTWHSQGGEGVNRSLVLDLADADADAHAEGELIERNSFQSKAQARMAVFTWIEGWYNPRRRHSGLSYLSPVNFERSHEALFDVVEDAHVHAETMYETV